MKRCIIYIIGIMSLINNLFITFEDFKILIQESYEYILLRYIPNIQVSSLVIFIINCLRYFIFFRL